MNPEDKHLALKQLQNEIEFLTQSPLYAYRTTHKYLPVIGEGSHNARIMFVGEAPGKNEAKTGRPFCGAAGKVLDALLESVSLARSDVYITNIVKDRPPENRDPLPDEIAMYGPFLKKQIDIIQPQIIATLGRHAMQYMFDQFGLGYQGAISTVHGTSFTAHAPYGTVQILVLYHPAAAIYNQALKTTLQRDFQILNDL